MTIEKEMEQRCEKRQLMAASMELVRSGKFRQAKRILDLLRKKSITCGLSDVEFDVSCILETIGVRNSISHKGAFQHFYLHK